MYETIEARAIPALKAKAAKLKQESKKGRDKCTKHVHEMCLAYTKKKVGRTISTEWLKKANCSKNYRGIRFKSDDGICVEIPTNDNELSNLDDLNYGKAECIKANRILEMCTHTGNLRSLAAYVRTCTGSTKKAMALSSGKFNSIVNKYIDDLLSDKSCPI